MNKYLKRILSIFIVFTITLTTLGLSTNKTFASENGFKFTVDRGTEQTINSQHLEFTHSNPVLQLSAENYNTSIASNLSVNITGPTHMYFITGDGSVAYHEVIDVGSQFGFTVNANYSELNPYSLIIGVEQGFPTEIQKVVLEKKVIADNKRPAISGEENFATNIDDAKPVTFFQSYLTAIDETDGDVTDRIWIERDNYSPNIKVIGRHEVIFGVDDLSGNKAFLTVYINVYDFTTPVITGDQSIVKIGYKETWNIESFRKLLKVTDNVDSLTNADIKLKSDGYTTNKSKLGIYDVVFEAKDKSGNETTFTKRVQVIDNVIPTFSGPSVITTSNNTILTEKDVRDQLTANDEIDKVITNKIELVEDNYTGKGNKVGSYTIKYQVKDNAGNVAYHTVTINRVDNVPPVIWIEDGVSIKTTINTPLTHQQIIDILIATGQVAVNSQTTFSVTNDEYTGNEEQPGIYGMTIKARSTSGNESVHNMSITVLSEEKNDNDINVNPPFNLWEYILDHKTPFIIGALTLIILLAAILYKKFKPKKRRRY